MFFSFQMTISKTDQHDVMFNEYEFYGDRNTYIENIPIEYTEYPSFFWTFC